MRPRTRRVVLLAIAGLVCSAVAIALLPGLLRHKRSTVVQPAEREAALQASAAFFAGVQKNSSIEIPELANAVCSDDVEETFNGRPYALIWGDLASDLRDGGGKYDGLQMEYDLFSGEIVDFGFAEFHGPLGREGDVVLLAEDRERLVAQAKEFVKTVAGPEYEFDRSEIQSDGRVVEVNFDRVVDGVNYVHDWASVRMSHAGFVLSFIRRREWSTVEIGKDLKSLANLEVLAKQHAVKLASEYLSGPLTATRIDSFYAAGRAKELVSHKQRSLLEGYRRSRVFYASSWIITSKDEAESKKAFVAAVALSARTGRRLVAEGWPFRSHEALDAAKEVF